MKNANPQDTNKGKNLINNSSHMSLIEKLKAMGFTNQEIEYNFSKSENQIGSIEKVEHQNKI